jgi:two-component system C4-dicarboxylate transport response regulator DctD
MDLDMPVVSTQTHAKIMARDWPENLIEMRSFARQYLEALHLSDESAKCLSLAEQLDNFEALVLTETLRQTTGKATQAAAQLGLPRKTFYDRLARYDIRPKDFK